jgi:hypothetical protein
MAGKRGFAAMDKEAQRAIASKGGRAAHARGTAHEFTSEEAAEAGRKGGRAVSLDRRHMAEIGRRGGKAAHTREGTDQPAALPDEQRPNGEQREMHNAEHRALPNGEHRASANGEERPATNGAPHAGANGEQQPMNGAQPRAHEDEKPALLAPQSHGE